jgi:hypothetical protein
MAYNYYLGPWPWDAQGSPACWTPPATTIAAVDLASLPQLASAVGSARPVGFFACTGTLDSSYTFLGSGDCRQIVSTKTNQAAWKAATGYQPTGTTLADLLFDQLTNGSDPTGQSACLPLVPTIDGQLEVVLAGHSPVRRQRFVWGSHAHTSKLKALLQHDFRVLFQLVQAKKAPALLHRKWLGWQCRKYVLTGPADWKQLVPADLLASVPGPLAPATTINDDFNRANSGTLGTATYGGVSQGWSWALTNGGTWQIVSNQAECTATGTGFDTFARAETDLSGSDHSAQVAVWFSGSSDALQGPTCRFSASANTMYLGGFRPVGADDRVFKVLSGTFTKILDVANGSGTYSNVQTTIQASGSTLTLTTPGAGGNSVTDTSISGGTRTGMYCQTANDIFDNFQAADLAAPAYRPPQSIVFLPPLSPACLE